MSNRELFRRVAVVGLAVSGAAVFAGCSSNSTATTTTSAPVTSTTAPASTSTAPSTTTATTTTTTSTAATLPPQTATQGAFYSPSKNISCELDFGGATGQAAYCFSMNPPQNATMQPSGAVQQCHGQSCLSNPGLNTPVLPYGTSMTLGPYTCLSETTGVTCRIATGTGFTISTSGIADVS